MTGSASSAAHVEHDDLLIARFLGDDLDVADTALARERIAACDACAGVYADLAAASEALRQVAVPRRTRDFRLTAADAERLGRRGAIRSAVGGLLRWARPAGGALMAAGLAGVLLTMNGALAGPAATQVTEGLGASYLSPAVARPATTAAIADRGGQSAGAGGYAAATASTALVKGASPAPSGKHTGDLAVTSPAVSDAASPAQNAVGPQAAQTSPASTGSGQEAFSPATPPGDSSGSKAAPLGNGTPSASPTSPAAASGPDLRAILALSLSGLALVAGFALLVVPALLRRAPRRR